MPRTARPTTRTTTPRPDGTGTGPTATTRPARDVRRPRRAAAGAVARGAGAAVVAAALVAGGATHATSAPVPAAAPAVVAVPRAAADHDVTSALEAGRVDAVATPDPQWFDCAAVLGAGSECGSITVPLDYDEPDGATTDVALLRVRATDPSRRVGTLLVNPGGPGGSGVQMAAMAPYAFSPALRERFDIVGMDPRGTNFSTAVRCFRDVGEQQAALAGMAVPFPVGDAQTAAFLGSAGGLATACSTTGAPLGGAMSTAQVARDLDVVRRAVGDDRLTFLGFSYGTYLGQVYASMFPDRVRAVAVDGVLDPVAWAGTSATAGVPVSARLGSGTAAARTLAEVWRRCAQAGAEVCRTAEVGAPQDVADGVAAGLRAAPVVVRDPVTDEVVETVTWASYVSDVLNLLYAPQGSADVDRLTWALHWLQQPATPENVELRTEARVVVIGYGRAQAVTAQELDRTRAAGAAAFATAGSGTAGYHETFPYPNAPEAFAAVLCTDSRNPSRPDAWVGASATQDAAAPGFGPAWTWSSAPCATQTWTARDEDAWTGTFDARTAAPVLVVGNLWDPATAYEGAQAAADLLPGSRLVTSDSWGHTAYGTSMCVTDAVDAYLVAGTLPAEGTTCTGDAQPFVPRVAAAGPLPPVVAPWPGALPRTR